MIIGGRDVVVPATDPNLEIVFGVLQAIWPDGVYHLVGGRIMYRLDTVFRQSSLEVEEFIVYDNMDTFKAWEAGGTPGGTLHVLISHGQITFVGHGPQKAGA